MTIDPPLIDPDCWAGKHESCVGGPCECPRHTDPAQPCWGGGSPIVVTG